MRWVWRGMSLVHAVLLGSACGVSDADEPTPVDTVMVSPPTLEVGTGSAAALEAEVMDPSGNVLRDRRVVWASANPAIATVSDKGIVTGVSAGRVDVAATAQGKSGIASVRVTPGAVSNVVVSPPDVSITVGKTATLTARLTDAAGTVLTGRAVTWSSADTRVVTVSASGVVTGVRRGAVVVSATSEGKIGTATVHVE
jgi:uncharacterized protein YjdB